MQQKITPNVWFNGNAKEAVEFYVAAFPDGKVGTTSYYPHEGLADFQEGLAGKELTIDFEICGYQLTAINAGPEFTPNPSISFTINFDPSRDDEAETHLNELWQKLIDGGKALMPLDTYPYSKRYGWVVDRYGVTWQLILTDQAGEPRPFIIPTLLFSGAHTNQAKEAVEYYLSIFQNTKPGMMSYYEEPTGPAKKGSLMYGDFMIENQWFAAMDSGVEQDFTFNEAISLVLLCKDQAEIDAYWEELSTAPEAEQCGWCKDRYGVSWQVVPANMGELMARPGAFAHLMEMKKLIVADF